MGRDTSLSPQSGRHDRQLVRYLLGLLPEKDTERFDEECVVDDDVAERLRVVEDDLVDAEPLPVADDLRS
jgi:hypothetical protein